MVWFKVDDNLPNSRKVLSIPRDRRAGAIGVWTLAGAWCSGALQDGFVPDFAITEIPSGIKHRADLVRSGLWVEATNDEGVTGIRFEKWAEHQPSRDEVEKKRADHAARQAAYRARRAASRDTSPGDDVTHNESSSDADVTDARPDPTRPDPTVLPTEVLSGKGKQPATRGCRLPDNWEPDAAQRAWVRAEHPFMDIDAVVEEFRDYWRGVPGAKGVKADWPATFRNNIRKRAETYQPLRPPRQVAQLAANVRRASY